MYSSYVLCFTVSVTVTVQAPLNMSLRIIVSVTDEFRVKTEHESITPSAYITAQTTCILDSLHWISVGRSEPRECGAENMVICPPFKCSAKPCFVYAC